MLLSTAKICAWLSCLSWKMSSLWKFHCESSFHLNQSISTLEIDFHVTFSFFLKWNSYYSLGIDWFETTNILILKFLHRKDYDSKELFLPSFLVVFIFYMFLLVSFVKDKKLLAFFSFYLFIFFKFLESC